MCVLGDALAALGAGRSCLNAFWLEIGLGEAVSEPVVLQPARRQLAFQATNFTAGSEAAPGVASRIPSSRWC
jgi:hypothetical protein